MRYFFESKINRQGDEGRIPIPFNIWEVCKQRDEIDADIVLDNRIINCQLLPQEKGIYEIALPAKELEGVDDSKTHKILLHVGGSGQANQTDRKDNDSFHGTDYIKIRQRVVENPSVPARGG